MQPQQPDNQNNLLIAIVLSMAVLLGWQYFYAGPKLQQEQARQQKDKQEQASKGGQPPAASPGTAQSPATSAGGKAPTAPGAAPAADAVAHAALSREQALAQSPRVAIETPSLRGSLALKGGRIDDLVLVKYREQVSPTSPNVTLFSPADAPAPYFAEYGWLPQAGSPQKAPGKDTVWTVEKGGKLGPGDPVVLAWDNGTGLVFRRTVSLDSDYMFTLTDEVENKSAGEVTLYPYARIYRYGQPKIEGFYIQHEGLIGVIGDAGLQEITYADVVKENGGKTFEKRSGGWLGFTDKYWAAALIPDQKATYRASMSAPERKTTPAGKDAFQTDYIQDAVSVPAGQKRSVNALLYAGAKQVHVIQGYKERYNILKFDLMIDWGWFYFITKPLFYLIHWLYNVLWHNFGLAILAVTVLVKLAFFPLANKSYESMAKMKKLQPEMERLRERYKDDKAAQQKELMALYSKEKINPLAGCLPILVQIPVFFALYKVLFVSIDMRHAPFFGWIKDLSAADPTSFSNLFGWLPWAPLEPHLLGYTIGFWPIIMGITMWLQMQLNPQQPDPVQQQIFNWMPVVFTFMLGGFASGLVIYWAWNNILSLLQQSYIMKKQGTEIPLMDNLRRTLGPLVGLSGKKGAKR